ncbi:MAG: putative metal-binding motif-containing protein [Proteobacteria bacterium]|nr:putative metal-binding motif-containing protein [Pseudomonadota bacterium]
MGGAAPVSDGYRWCAEDGDCNDADPEIHPGAPDLCLDGIDQECSGADRTKGKGCPRESKAAAEGKGKTCSDGVDNDGDGLTDFADPDCGTSRACP